MVFVGGKPFRIFHFNHSCAFSFDIFVIMVTWKNIQRPLILASKSPRRQEILSRMGLKYEVKTDDTLDESRYIKADSLECSLLDLARAKAETIAGDYPEHLVLGADTVVVSDSQVLGKPSDVQDARRMLRRLSGRAHEVFTAVSLECRADAFHDSALAKTDVYFRDVPDEEIEEYLQWNEYVDKAGAYAIQGLAMTFVERIDGCYYNVVGLPVSVTIDLFKNYAAGKAQ